MSPREEELLVTSRFRVVRTARESAGATGRAREVIRHPGSVVILPLIDDRHICLIRNFRIAVNQDLLELPAGTLEPGEDPLSCARRELEEETGYTSETIRPLIEFFAAPGILDERMYAFVADGLLAGVPRPEPDETIASVPVTWDEALEAIRTNRIQDAKTIVTLLVYDRFHRTT